MSTAVDRKQTRGHAPAPAPRRAPTRRTLPPGSRRTPPADASPRRRASRAPSPAISFLVVVGLVLFGVVATEALLGNRAMQIEAARAHLADLRAEHRRLLEQQATLSSPERVAAWGADHGMVFATDIRVIGAGDAASA